MNTIELEEEEFFSARSSISSSSSQEYFLSSSPTEDPPSQTAVESSHCRLIQVKEKDSGNGRKVIVLRSRSSVQFHRF